MPFALLLIGLVLVVTGAKGTMRELGSEIREDFIGPGNFTWWIASIGVVGTLGYVQELRTFSRVFMALIVISMVLSNRGFFNKFTEALNTGPVSPKPVAQPSAGTSGGNGLGGVLSLASKFLSPIPLPF